LTTITLDRLCKRGYISMLSVYERIAHHLNEPLFANGEAIANTKIKLFNLMSIPAWEFIPLKAGVVWTRSLTVTRQGRLLD